MKKRYIFGAAVVVLVVAYLFYLSFSGSVSYYLTVSEFYDRGTELHDTAIRLAGKISEPIEWNAANVELSFVITEGGRDITVIYNGARPSGFKVGSSILVEGNCGSDGIFRANQLLMKCPSKYELEEQSK